MRILVNARFLIPGKLEGIGLYTFEILKELVKQRPDDQFILCIDRQSSTTFDLGTNTRYHLIRPPARHPFLFIWWFEVGIPLAYRKYKADLFFSPDGFLSTSLQINRSILVIHDLAYLHFPYQIGPLTRWYYRKFMPKYIAHASHIVAVSQSTKDDITRNFPATLPQITVVYNGVRKESGIDHGKITDRSLSSNHPYFFSVGSIHPRKNISGLLDAFAIYKADDQQGTKLVIVGRMAWKTSSVFKKYKEHPFKRDIIMTGYLPDNEMFALMRHSVALIYVSLFEGFGLPIVEAMHNRVPVITSNRSSMQEIAGNAALLVDPQSPHDIATAMTKLMQEPDLRADLIEKGQGRIKIFNWSDAGVALSQIIQNL